MKLLFENWRKYISEDDDEEERTDADKIKDLFIHNAAQALHIAEQVDVDPEMVAAMKEVVSHIHQVMESFRGAVDAKSYAEARKVPPVRGLYKKFEEAMVKIYGQDLWDSSTELHDIDKSVYDLYNNAYVAREYYGEPTSSIAAQGTNNRAYKFVAEWAGGPQ